MPTREDLVPHYREDLMAKLGRVRQAILDLTSFGLPELKDVTPEEYELIRLSVINSIKGTDIALSEKSRQSWVEEMFLKPAKLGELITDYVDESGKEKCDFVGTLASAKRFGIEVKGGEGNSVTLFTRPQDSDVFAVWSFLDVMSNTPQDNMRAVLGRVIKQMVSVDEKLQHVDLLIFYDTWYVRGIKRFKHGNSMPDVIVFPDAIPRKSAPHPKPGNPKMKPLLKEIYQVLAGRGLDDIQVKSHIWICDLWVEKENSQWVRKMKVTNWAHPSITLSSQPILKAKAKPAD